MGDCCHEELQQVIIFTAEIFNMQNNISFPATSYNNLLTCFHILLVKCLFLQEEENVLAQEAVLEALLRSDHRHSHWPVWDSEEQLGMVC